jgi:hypothetical protein
VAPLPDAADELFDLDPSRFVAARDALARDLKARGEVAAADAVKALRKPSVAAAALNRVARDEPGLVQSVMEATAAVAKAQAAGGDALREAGRTRRAAVQQLVSRASSISGAAHRDAISGTVEATAVDGEVAELLRAGRLTRDMAAPGAFDLTGVPERATSPARKPRVDAALARRRAKAAADVERAQRDLDAAQAALAKAEDRAVAARAALDAARAVLDDLD